jgi:hypothetical protein
MPTRLAAALLIAFVIPSCAATSSNLPDVTGDEPAETAALCSQGFYSPACPDWWHDSGH